MNTEDTMTLRTLAEYRAEQREKFLSTLHYQPKMRYIEQERKKEVKKSYVNFLKGINWRYFVTATTQFFLTKNLATKLIDRLFKRVGGNQMFYVIEPFADGNGYHLHFLIQSNSTQPYIIQSWHNITGSTDSRIEVQRYKKGVGAEGYISKYIGNDKVEYNFISNTNEEQSTKDSMLS